MGSICEYNAAKKLNSCFDLVFFDIYVSSLGDPSPFGIKSMIFELSFWARLLGLGC